MRPRPGVNRSSSTAGSAVCFVFVSTVHVPLGRFDTRTTTAATGLRERRVREHRSE
jgi:hypothetical protein